MALVGAPTSDALGDHISVLALDGAGARVVYRKMWMSEAEAERFVPGPAPAIIEVDGWRLGLAVCKDTGVSAHADATAGLGMDAYVAGCSIRGRCSSLLRPRPRRWRQLLVSRRCAPV